MFETWAVSVLADLAWPPPDRTGLDEDTPVIGRVTHPDRRRQPSVLDGVRLGWRQPKGWPVTEPLAPLLPGGLRRGSTLTVAGSASLLLALLGAASDAEALIALVGLPTLSTDAMAEHGIDLSRTAVIPDPGRSWTRTIGALLDTVDVVVTHPHPRLRLAASETQRLAARARTREAVLLAYLPSAAPSGSAQWPHADMRLHADPSEWEGLGNGHGRLRQRQVTVTAHGRGSAERARSMTLWLPAADGSVAAVEPLATVTALHPRAG